MKVIPITPTTKPQTKQQRKPKPTDRPTFTEYLLLALANGKERTR